MPVGDKALLAGSDAPGYAAYCAASAGVVGLVRAVAHDVAAKKITCNAIVAASTVEPEEVVDVGAQVAGQINTFGTDANGKPVDYGSPVTEGMTLAQIAEIERLKLPDRSAQLGEFLLAELQSKIPQKFENGTCSPV